MVEALQLAREQGTLEDTHLNDGDGTQGTIIPMSRSLDTVLALDEKVEDLQIVQRQLQDGQGQFEALHNVGLSRSLMSGTFESVVSTGGKITYEGTFLNDPHQESPTPHGAGVRVNADGSSYTGQWKDGLPDGHGEWKAPPPSCEHYVGEWKRGKKHGFGHYRLANGDIYEGDFKDGKYQDRGKYIYVNGDEFVGMWENGMKERGSFHYKDGRISRRVWQNGKLVSCQEFDARQKSYQPTRTSAQVHDAEKTAFGAKNSSYGMISPRGIRIP